ncbi:hypothetical protein AFM11_29555 [Mycolicibacterium wolinskyi]|uniref:Serine protease n=1 Tax=Mycolicibacterium wolinskyi TaxID=59750 RepID=A0A132PEY2_9MYCO|nr:serine protease [Mycolicibacterium wolinskyi]KWX20552.1 hypothetical protein AFM11_29555 [Mycolicibacterium wolinskyi]
MSSKGLGVVQRRILDMLARNMNDPMQDWNSGFASWTPIIELAGPTANRAEVESMRRAAVKLADIGMIDVTEIPRQVYSDALQQRIERSVLAARLPLQGEIRRQWEAERAIRGVPDVIDRVDGERRRLNVQIPKESIRSLFLEMVYVGDGDDVTPAPVTTLATGTGFFCRVDGSDFLVTARHNLSGRHWETKEYLSKGHPVAPTHIRIGLRATPPPGGYSLNDAQRIMLYQLALTDDDGPLWREHPTYRDDMDVAVLPMRLPGDDNVLVVPWEPQTAEVADANNKLWVTQDITIVGYPYGLKSGELPLWARGTIASEPSFLYTYNDRELPLFLSDARTRPGQSGSPVLLFRPPGTLVVTDKGEVAITKGTQSKLLGVYTGRVNADSDLGFVWRIGEVWTICRRGVRGVA